MDNQNVGINPETQQPLSPQVTQPQFSSPGSAQESQTPPPALTPNQTPVKSNKLLKWSVRVVLLAVFAVLFLEVLPGNNSYLKSYLGNAYAASGTPASCTKTVYSYSSKKGFPLAYSYNLNEQSNFNCASSGQGVGQTTSEIPISPSLVKSAYIGLAADIASAFIAAFLVALIAKKVSHSKL